MKTCDFSKSHLRFTSNRINNTARLQLDGLCYLTEGGKTTRYALTAPCIAENMYEDKGLIQVPTCEFRMIASEQEYRMIKDYPTHDLDADMARRKDETHVTFDGKKPQLTELTIFVKDADSAHELRSYEEFKQAFLGNQSLVGITELKSPDGKFAARMEYPIMTSNIQKPKDRWQVDAGPVLFPVFARSVKLTVELFARAYIVFNQFDWAEIIIHQPAPLMKDGKEVVVSTDYHAPFRVAAPSRLFAF